MALIWDFIARRPTDIDKCCRALLPWIIKLKMLFTIGLLNFGFSKLARHFKRNNRDASFVAPRSPSHTAVTMVTFIRVSCLQSHELVWEQRNHVSNSHVSESSSERPPVRTRGPSVNFCIDQITSTKTCVRFFLGYSNSLTSVSAVLMLVCSPTSPQMLHPTRLDAY